jgi:teichuronic acid biosynthesis glycosyltransferase TuaG
MNRLVTVIIPNFNNAEFIIECINSVINQNFQNWEIIFIDDASSDNSKEKLTIFKNSEKIKIIELKKNKGPSFCRNIGIRQSKGKYIAFLDSDDYWLPNKLERQIKFMQENNYKISYTDYFSFKKIRDSKTILKNTNVRKKYNFENFIKDTSIGTSTLILTKDVIGNTKFKKISIMEDYLFKCEILRKGVYAFKFDEVLTAYRIRSKSRNSNIIKNISILWKINKKYLNLGNFKSFFSILSIVLSSLKKYGLRKYN